MHSTAAGEDEANSRSCSPSPSPSPSPLPSPPSLQGSSMAGKGRAGCCWEQSSPYGPPTALLPRGSRWRRACLRAIHSSCSARSRCKSLEVIEDARCECAGNKRAALPGWPRGAGLHRQEPWGCLNVRRVCGRPARAPPLGSRNQPVGYRAGSNVCVCSSSCTVQTICRSVAAARLTPWDVYHAAPLSIYLDLGDGAEEVSLGALEKAREAGLHSAEALHI